ncbi:MAG TPA: RNase adapter RapZ, partial [Solirubrobacterales bacterium]|nr:RNase adapter RapZ [Solirubrobacterales bacterium]
MASETDTAQEAKARREMTLVIITGHSGAGKSEAIAAFEDGGYFCVDNLPPRMIAGLGELFIHEGAGVECAAIVSDVRGGDYFDDLLQVLDELKGVGPARKRALLQHFGSPERFLAASREELE